MLALVLIAYGVVAAVTGAWIGPHVVTLYTSWSGSRAVKAAHAIIAKAEADAKALAAAKAVVAAAPPVTGVTGPHV